MSRILLLSPASAMVIPALGLLPHDLTVAPLSPQSLASHPDVDLVLIDGVTDLVAAKSMASVLASAQLPVPVLLVGHAASSVLDGHRGGHRHGHGDLGPGRP